jgi:MOSC domain-containing protein YiiM
MHRNRLTVGQFREGAHVSVGKVISIHIIGAAGDTPRSIQSALAVPGRGLEGDRYFSHIGTYSDTPGTGRDLTLIESEQIEGIQREYGITIAPGASRRNITTSGVSLNELVDRDFKIGEITVRGMRLCEPCAYLAGLIGNPEALKALVHRGGLRCDILTEGTIRVGDAITPS